MILVLMNVCFLDFVLGHAQLMHVCPETRPDFMAIGSALHLTPWQSESSNT